MSTLADLQTFINGLAPFGFMTEAQLAELIKLSRLQPVLVRCSGCRFVCGAQDAPKLIKAVELSGDYVRDVSIHKGGLLT